MHSLGRLILQIQGIKNNNLTFRGPLDGTITNILRACDTNEMVNAVGLDVGAMVIPRSYYDTKARNQFAGAETFFREISGTFINCISAGLLAQIISHVASKCVMKDVNTNPASWYSKDSLSILHEAWEKGGKTTDGYLNTVLENLSGRDGHKINNFKDINWQAVEWNDEKVWDRINWKNAKYKGIQDKLKTKEDFINTFKEVIEDKNIAKDDKKNVLSIMDKRLTNALQAGRSVTVKVGDNKLETSLWNVLRDTQDMGRDIFTNPKINIEAAFKKIHKVNKIKGIGAITGACLLGLTNQYINRKITEKRTGKKGFVGDVDFTSESHENKKDKNLIYKKLGASALMIGMVASVMRVKNFKEFAKKLEFTGPITSGNAIKTVYAATITGRFMAADNGTELRESMTRDILGFLNWLVFGGFAAKGVANLLDKGGNNLFNYSKEGKGLKHWLNDMFLKTHNEVASKGKEFTKKNLWKLNVANAAGIAYSAITLGILLPMLNAKVTKHKAKKQQENKLN